jgi:benzoyl-CoA-dihydrodiol lyase
MMDFRTKPEDYKHWRLSFEGPVARLEMAVAQNKPFGEGYELKLNSYDLGVDIELADAVQRIRFEHPEVKVVVVTSAWDKVFCAGANIRMLGLSSHPFKVNFCKFTNETRLGIEDSSRFSGIRWIAALNGICAGGGYELALACDEIYLVDDNNSAVSLPEVPLLGVLPGTGGLTRLVDKRKVRRDLADVFCTLAEGVKGKRAVEWNLIDGTFPKSKFQEKVAERARELEASLPARDAEGGLGLSLEPIQVELMENAWVYEHVRVDLDRKARVATLTIQGPSGEQPRSGADYLARGCEAWAVAACRQLDDALLRLRFGELEIGLIKLLTRGDAEALLQVEGDLLADQGHWLSREIMAYWARTLRRIDLTARSLFAIADRESCMAGVFLEMALAADRIYALDQEEAQVHFAIGPWSNGTLPMSHGPTRLQVRFLADPTKADRLATEQPKLTAKEAEEQGLTTFLFDEIDWDDELRIAIEERASLSPDALTGLEASLRFAGPETCDSKIFGRLSAWQNWIFIRPNATGEEGALVRYGNPEPARFDWRRT